MQGPEGRCGVKNFDIAIIGSGPGGYVAALYASRRSVSVCVIEKDLVGGTCLNRGCIPTKSLINSALVASGLKTAPAHGVIVDGYSIDFGTMMSRKAEVVTRLRTGIETLFRGSKVALVKGTAKITAPDTISVDGREEIKAKYIIIASGSRVSGLPGITIDESVIFSSDGILDIKHVPASLAVIGGGVIGCEFASLFNKLGSKVTIIEMTERLIPTQSREISKKLEMVFKKGGVDIHTGCTVESIGKGAACGVSISGGTRVEAEKVLVSVGRRANTEALGLEGLGIRTQNGRICVDQHLRTSVPNIYAVGDCVPGPLLAHKASYDGILACDHIAGKPRKADYSNIPNCIWTDPEIASVGLSEDEAKAGHHDVKVAKFPYLASGKAYLEGETEGFVKIIGTPKGEILGVEIFGKEACNLIGEATLARTAAVTIKDWSCVVHGHPTLSEMFQEAAHIFCGTAIHSVV